MIKEKKTLEQLSKRERLVYDICTKFKSAENSNTDLLIFVWSIKADESLKKRPEWGTDQIHHFMRAIRKYKPESITRIRRNLTEWGLIFPDKKIQKERMRMSNNWKGDIETKIELKRQDKHLSNI